jgi:hypothetical protein
MSSRLVSVHALLCSLVFGALACGDDADAEFDAAASPLSPADAAVPTTDAGNPTPPSGDAQDSGAATPVKLDGGSANPDDPTPTAEAGTSVPDTGPGDGPSQGACLDGITDYAKAGPFKFASKNSGSVKIWVPEVPAGCKVPVIHLANGTGASCGTYRAVLERFASHGFVSCCYENANTGAGTQGVMAFDTVLKMFPDLVDKKLGSTGHSQGGQAAFTVLSLSEAKWGDSYTYAGLAIEPASGFGTQPSPGPWQTVYSKIKSPMFMFSGTADILVSAGWVQRGFDALADSVEAYNWSAVGASHIPVPNSETMEVGVPWFRWKLLGDNKACEAFKALPATNRWDEKKVQNAKPCQ